ncbi:MAG: GTP 3',8-cyclase MoaA [Promethearchaeati archaeon SRVP18_Atabeyarchaeia-1]
MITLSDPFGRGISNIRISLTERCNLNCSYCHKEGHSSKSGRELSPSEVERLMRVATSLGINRVKLTGGEPTLRGDLVEIIGRIALIPGIGEISMTTNGTLLENLATELKRVGLGRVNVTIDSLKPEVYSRITGHDSLDDAIRGLEAAVTAKLTPAKINTVVLKSVNESEVQDLISFSSKMGVILQLIELVSKNDHTGFYRKYHYDLGPIEDSLRRESVKAIDRVMNKRRKYILPNGSEVEIVKPMHNTEFCSNCHRIRLTSDGQLKPCLMRDENLVDVISPLRRGATDSQLAALIREAVQRREPYYRATL